MLPPVQLVAIDVDGTLLPSIGSLISPRNGRALAAAERAGIRVAIATGRRTAYTTPLLENLGLRANTLLLTSNGAVLRTLGGEALDRCHMKPHVARALCALLRPFGCLVFTFDRPDRPELVLEDMQTAEKSISLWIEANRNAIALVRPLESAFPDATDPEDYPIQGMLAGPVERMRQAEAALKASPLADSCDCVRTEYPARNLSILDLMPRGVSKGVGLRRLAARLGIDRLQVMAIGDNWNDVDMLEWAGQSVVMGNAAAELRALAKTRGWCQAPPNDSDGVAVALEAALARLAFAQS
jgi:Cof subfamily protein (haloacid dehalogenase superfamily)